MTDISVQTVVGPVQLLFVVNQTSHHVYNDWQNEICQNDEPILRPMTMRV